MNPARLFISYRSSDGVDKATALARDLNAVFGDAQVFLDKEDLPAGQPWREAIGATLDDKPVLLLLVTPHTFGQRIAEPDDPVRRELTVALEFGAHVIPLLCDGVDKLPEPADLPEALRTLGERTWRRLRAYDWRDDFERLVEDLQQLGLARLAREQGRRRADRRRLLEVGLAFCGGTLAGTGAAAWWWQAPPHADGLSGAWSLQAEPPANEAGSRLDAVLLHLSQSGEALSLYSEPIDIRDDPAWAGFASQWHERFGEKLERVVWRGSGTARLAAGAPPAIDVALRVETPAGGDPIETGKLHAQASADGQRLLGRLWMNGEQAERALQMRRGAQP
jgi:hypothetical protein